MYGFLFFVLIIGTVLALDLIEVEKKCGRPLLMGKECCKSLPELPLDIKNNMKECSQLPVYTCEREICMAIKTGTGTADGKLIMDKATENVENVFKDSMEIIDAIKSECIGKDLKKYGTPDTCEIQNWKHCIDVQLMKTCSEWLEDDKCKGLKESSQDCVELFQ